LRHRTDAVIAIPTLPHLKKYLENFFAGKGINPILIDNDEDKFDCFSASAVALAASGTVSLELALTDTPHIIAYKLSPFTAWLAKYLVKTPYVNLINILLHRLVVPELLQERCEPELISRELFRLLEKKDLRTAQLMDFHEALIKVGLGDIESPSQKAAGAVLSVIESTGAGT
jgi:lipid-A-disaccharide synthase